MNSFLSKLKPKLKAIVLFSGLAALLAFGFQNCSATRAPVNPKSTVGTENTTSSGSNSSASTSPNSSNSSNPNQSNNSANTNNGEVIPDLLSNFMSDDKQTCDNAIKARTSKPYTCLMGAGCGISCGVPGGNCASANPTKYGACIMAPPPSFSGCLPAGTSFPIACDAVTGSATLKWSGCCSGTYVKSCGALGTTAANKVVCQ